MCKLIASILALSMRKVIGKVISESQNMEGRQIVAANQDYRFTTKKQHYRGCPQGGY